ncbi:hypothetical protein GCM10027342_18710 [Photobacterium alginatilyticum]
MTVPQQAEIQIQGAEQSYLVTAAVVPIMVVVLTMVATPEITAAIAEATAIRRVVILLTRC